MSNTLKHIELFAGCGGMTLGLESAGFELFMANELSPMAAETFAYNLLGENLSKLSESQKRPSKVLWLKSGFPIKELNKRLRENPFEVGKKAKETYTDVNSKTDLSNKLIIGNIDDFLSVLHANKPLRDQLKDLNIDLLSGGPPCQGFSLAGKRIKDDKKNLLPLSFAEFAGLAQPKIILLENVKGITSAFETPDGSKHYAWIEVAKAFALKKYVPICMMVNSKYFGVPQNRPRFILFAFRKDIFDNLKSKRSNSNLTNSILLNSLGFYNKVHQKRKHLDEIKLSDILLYDIESNSDFFDGNLLPKLKTTEKDFITASYAIDDITSIRKQYPLNKIRSKYSLLLAELFKPKFITNIQELQNHEHRNHSYKVKARFRLHQILNDLNGMRQDALQVISGKCGDEEVIKKVFNAFKEETLLVESGKSQMLDSPRSLSHFKEYLSQIKSKKHSQRAIKKNEPAPAQMTIPDDLCHYSPKELRTLTVREMARLQSFPDWFVFRSKVTTGGQQRSFEVPQYTQVGNAVPPMLAYELGKTINKLLESVA